MTTDVSDCETALLPLMSETCNTHPCSKGNVFCIIVNSHCLKLHSVNNRKWCKNTRSYNTYINYNYNYINIIIGSSLSG